METVEQRGNWWYVRYRDNPDDPWHREGPFYNQAAALQWLADNPVVEIDGDEDQA